VLNIYVKFIELDTEARKERITTVLRYLTFQSGYTQRSLAERLDVNRSTVGHILSGERYLGFVDSIDWFSVLGITPRKFYELLDTGVGLEEDWVKK